MRLLCRLEKKKLKPPETASETASDTREPDGEHLYQVLPVPGSVAFCQDTYQLRFELVLSDR